MLGGHVVTLTTINETPSAETEAPLGGKLLLWHTTSSSTACTRSCRLLIGGLNKEGGQLELAQDQAANHVVVEGSFDLKCSANRSNPPTIGRSGRCPVPVSSFLG